MSELYYKDYIKEGNIDEIDIGVVEIIELMRADLHPLEDRMSATWVKDGNSYKQEEYDSVVPDYYYHKSKEWRQWQAMTAAAYEGGQYGEWFDYMTVWANRPRYKGMWGAFIDGRFQGGGRAVGIITAPPRPIRWDGKAHNHVGVMWYYSLDRLVRALRIGTTEHMVLGGGTCRQRHIYCPQFDMLSPKEALESVIQIAEERRKEDIRGV
jgi:hypothetical protein